MKPKIAFGAIVLIEALALWLAAFATAEHKVSNGLTVTGNPHGLRASDPGF